MLISLIGSFSSGKTTLGAKLFASLKDQSYISEFIPEVARQYIAKRRVTSGLHPTDTITLSDIDQLEIFQLQLEAEQLMVKACGDNVFIITDSSVYNSLLYMNPSFLINEEVIDLLVKAKSFYDSISYKVYICNPIDNKSSLADKALAPGQNPIPPVPQPPFPLDPNRIHGPELAKSIEARVEWYFGQGQVLHLEGDSNSRVRFVLNDILWVGHDS